MLLQEDIVIGHQGIRADRRQIAGNGHAAFLYLRFDGLTFAEFHDYHDNAGQQDHQTHDPDGQFGTEAHVSIAHACPHFLELTGPGCVKRIFHIGMY